MIPKSECKHRGLYRIRSRNLVLGVYNEPTGGFVGLRTKFGRVYPFEEYHWDNGPPFGTVTPLELLSDVLPEHIEPTELLPGNFCSKCHREYVMPETAQFVRESWHLDDNSPLCEGAHGYVNPNRDLHQWLEEMEKKHCPSSV